MTTPASQPAAAQPASTKGQEKSRYRATLNLPQTTFPMKANLVQNEPASQKRWAKLGLYNKLREARQGKPRFAFHDGPPYANGSIHLGHLMNKTLKDFVVRAKSMADLDCPYIPGWDCHGLPIEHKVMTELVEGGKVEKLKTLDEWTRRMAVRRECQKHAERYIKLQAGQMQRLLTLADYDHPYLTMAPQYEGDTLEVLATLLERGLVYRALKPVHWSIANETALAEAELEYYDREDLSVYVDFEAADGEAVYDAFGLKDEETDESLEDADGADDAQASAESGDAESKRGGPPKGRPSQRPTFMIWTTTPWTLPANLAIALNPKFDYALVWVDGNISVMAADAVERVTKLAKAEEVAILARTTGDKLMGLKYRHPFVDLARSEGVASPAFTSAARQKATTDKVYSVMAADYVTLEDGTGLVHTAPGHGTEDYQTGLREGLPIYCPVRADGTYDPTVPEWLRTLSVWDANEKVAKHLRDSGHLFYDHKFTHSYPHDWRSKTPTIYRCTEQWFVAVDQDFAVEKHGQASLRKRSLDAVSPGEHAVKFVPEWGRNRMRGMLESRPDWCISRQRAWGLPIPAFVLDDGTTFMTPASVRAVIALVKAKGSDAWFQLPPAELLAGYNPVTDPHAATAVQAAHAASWTTVKKGGDIIDVWFESGSSWNSVVRARNLGYPADLYLEGSDQHRGWFQASLLPALGVTGQPPFKTLLTHGFMVDKDGRKLSKSRADAARYEVDNLTVEFGVDVMRWWVASLPYENDVKVDVDFFTVAGESYRKVRNTIRFMLSNLYDYTGKGEADFTPTSLDAWVLSEFNRVSADVIAAYHAFDFKTAQSKLYDFCNDTLSAVYLAAVKDRLYCDKADAPRRRRTQAALYLITDGLARLLAPILPHTADETYRALTKADANSDACVHLQTFAPPAPVTVDPAWSEVSNLRNAALGELEKVRQQLRERESAGDPAAKSAEPLDFGVTLPDPSGTLARFDKEDLADLLGISLIRIDPEATAVAVEDRRTQPQCERSWKRDGTVKQRSDGGLLTDRDAHAVGVQ